MEFLFVAEDVLPLLLIPSINVVSAIYTVYGLPFSFFVNPANDTNSTAAVYGNVPYIYTLHTTQLKR